MSRGKLAPDRMRLGGSDNWTPAVLAQLSPTARTDITWGASLEMKLSFFQRGHKPFSSSLTKDIL
ncbi:MAG TPA: hypothetical protein VGC21_21910 [Telluria sp.]